MAKAKVIGIELFTEDITRMADLTEEAVGKAIYNGANILANAVSAEINAIPTIGNNEHGTGDKPIKGITKAQKDGLSESFGIAKMRNDDGTYNVKMGFDGYNGLTTKKYPNGQPNAMIARSLESGTSFRAKIPFISRAFNKAKQQSEQTMKAVFESYFK